MDEVLIDNLVVFSAIIYYVFLCIVYLLRAYENDELELMFAPVFSFLLVPFALRGVRAARNRVTRDDAGAFTEYPRKLAR